MFAECDSRDDRRTLNSERFGDPQWWRTWWAHFECTRIHIEPTILRRKIEEQLTVGAFHTVERRCSCLDSAARSFLA